MNSYARCFSPTILLLLLSVLLFPAEARRLPNINIDGVAPDLEELREDVPRTNVRPFPFSRDGDDVIMKRLAI